MSAAFSLNTADAKHIGKVFLYSTAAVGCAAFAAVLAKLQVPAAFLPLVPLANAAIVALEKYCEDKENV